MQQLLSLVNRLKYLNMSMSDFVRPEWCGRADDCPHRDWNEMISWRDPVTFGLVSSPECVCNKQVKEINKVINVPQ